MTDITTPPAETAPDGSPLEGDGIAMACPGCGIMRVQVVVTFLTDSSAELSCLPCHLRRMDEVMRVLLDGTPGEQA